MITHWNTWDLIVDNPSFALATKALDAAWDRAKVLAPDRLPAERAKHAAKGMLATMEHFWRVGAMGSLPKAELARRIKEHFNVEYAA